METNARSVGIYGANGAGKSSFVDALEYALNNGRIRHLAHEYSGKHQEKAIVNTHRPSDATSTIIVEFIDKRSARIEIAPSGAHSVSGDGVEHLANWDCRRTVLRQDEVSEFVHSTKGQKYSVLLPLLGLGHLETAAENTRQLGAAVVKQSGIKEASAALRNAWNQCESVYGKDRPSTPFAGLVQLCEAFVSEAHPHTAPGCVDRLEKAIDTKLEDAAGLQRLQVALEQLASSDIRRAVGKARAAASALAQAAGEGVQKQLDVIKAAAAFLEGPSGESVNECPACGKSVSHAEMKAHLDGEMVRLEGAIEKSRSYIDAIRTVLRSADRVIALCKSSEIKQWALSHNDARLHPIIEGASSLVLDSDRLSESQLDTISKVLGDAVFAAGSAAAFLPPPAKELARAKERLLSVKGLLSAAENAANAKRAEALAIQITTSEAVLRHQIHDQTLAVIADISSDIQRMWRILHPGDPIEDVRLHIPNDADKAIDVSLKFHGKDLESPRLTLSEGYRNSLGLCVFLAMAARDSSGDLPIVLDDVIVSLDRGHRGMVVSLLQQEFANRQVLLFTHDRDWYADLRQQLNEKEWIFQALAPYQSPNEGIRWSHRTGTFDDARVFLATRPDVAASEARKVMDVELSLHGERLGIRVLHRRGEKNDKRMAHEFLEILVSEGKSAFKTKDATTGKYVMHTEAIGAFQAADALLLSWANRGSHTEDVVRNEAERLLDVCDKAIAVLRCSACTRFVHFAEIAGGHQCECGVLRWK